MAFNKIVHNIMLFVTNYILYGHSEGTHGFVFRVQVGERFFC